MEPWSLGPRSPAVAHRGTIRHARHFMKTNSKMIEGKVPRRRSTDGPAVGASGSERTPRQNDDAGTISMAADALRGPQAAAPSTSTKSPGLQLLPGKGKSTPWSGDWQNRVLAVCEHGGDHKEAEPEEEAHEPERHSSPKRQQAVRSPSAPESKPTRATGGRERDRLTAGGQHLMWPCRHKLDADCPAPPIRPANPKADPAPRRLSVVVLGHEQEEQPDRRAWWRQLLCNSHSDAGSASNRPPAVPSAHIHRRDGHPCFTSVVAGQAEAPLEVPLEGASPETKRLAAELIGLGKEVIIRADCEDVTHSRRKRAEELADKYCGQLDRLSDRRAVWRRKHEVWMRKRAKASLCLLAGRHDYNDFYEHLSPLSGVQEPTSPNGSLGDTCKSASDSDRDCGQRDRLGSSSSSTPRNVSIGQNRSHDEEERREEKQRRRVSSRAQGSLYEQVIKSTSPKAAAIVRLSFGGEDSVPLQPIGEVDGGAQASTPRSSFDVSQRRDTRSDSRDLELPFVRQTSSSSSAVFSPSLPSRTPSLIDMDSGRRQSRVLQKRKSLKDPMASRRVSTSSDRLCMSRLRGGSKDSSGHGSDDEVEGARGALARSFTEKHKNFEYISDVAARHNLAPDEVKTKIAEFTGYAGGVDESLTMTQFTDVVRHYCGLSGNTEVPQHLVQKAMMIADKDGNGTVEFEEFLTWTVNTAFMEDVIVKDAKERELRQLARDFSVDLTDVERIRDAYDKYDEDLSGYIEEGEFKKLVLVLLKAKKESDVPAKRLMRYWKEVDQDHSGEIDFEEFFAWYLKYFYVPPDSQNSSNPAAQAYAGYGRYKLFEPR